MPMRYLIPAFVIAAAALGAGAAYGQLVLPSGSQGSVSLARIDEIVVYHKQWEELIVRATIAEPVDMPTIERLAFVVPVPGIPDLAELQSSDVFTELKAFEQRHPDGADKVPEIAGDYVLSTVAREQGKPICETLNRWLELNGLNTIEESKLKWYDENGWSFVVQRISRTSHHGAGALKPVRISFEESYVTFPLKHAVQDQPVSATLFLITKDNLDTSLLEDYGFTLRLGADVPNRVNFKSLPQSVETMVTKFGNHRGVFKELRRGHVYLYSALADFTPGDASRQQWEADVQIAGPRMSVAGLTQNALAIAAAVLTIVLMSLPKKKPANDRNTAKTPD